jgi:hypothetical protein
MIINNIDATTDSAEIERSVEKAADVLRDLEALSRDSQLTRAERAWVEKQISAVKDQVAELERMQSRREADERVESLHRLAVERNSSVGFATVPTENIHDHPFMGNHGGRMDLDDHQRQYSGWSTHHTSAAPKERVSDNNLQPIQIRATKDSLEELVYEPIDDPEDEERYNCERVGALIAETLHDALPSIIRDHHDDIAAQGRASEQGTYIHGLFSDFARDYLSKIGLEEGKDFSLAARGQKGIDLKLMFISHQFDLKVSEGENEGLVFHKNIMSTPKGSLPQLVEYGKLGQDSGEADFLFVITYDAPWRQ